MRTYATTGDLPGGLTVSDPDGYIERASILVERATNLDQYEVDDDGLPTEARVVDAFRDAVVAQVRFWAAANINPFGETLGQAPEVTSQSADGGSVSYSTTRSTEEVSKATGSLCEAARDVLRINQLADANGKPLLW